MPRLTRSVPQYRKHKASGQAFVELSGKRIYLGPYGTKISKLEYDRLTGEWLQNGRKIETPDVSEVTIAELLVAFLTWARGYYNKNGEPTSEVRDIELSLRSLRELYARTPCSDFGPIALKAVRQRMIDAGLSRGVINQRIGRIKRMFQWGAGDEMIPASIHARTS